MKRSNLYMVFAAALCLAGCSGNAKGQAVDNVALLAQVKKQSTGDVLKPQSQHALSSFYRDLALLESGRKSQLAILQLGDSHTANDFFSGRLRSQFQQRFGDAGRGMMPPGVVYKGISHKDVKPEQNEDWIIENSLKNPEHGPYGISGFVARSLRAGAQMQLVSTAPENGFDEVSVDYLQHPGGGKFKLLIDGKMAATVSTNGKEGQNGHFVMRALQRAHDMTVIALQKNIALTSWRTQRNDHGITLVSHGVVGATAELFSRWSPDIMKADIAQVKPSLIIVAYGTNEGFEDKFDPEKYAQIFAGLLTTLKHAVPSASILVVGPPDAERAYGCNAGACNWHRPPALEMVRAIQRSAAQSAGADFWDWSGIMQDGMQSWVDGGWARTDHVHFKIPGYEAAANQLFERLMTGYNVFKTHNHRQ